MDRLVVSDVKEVNLIFQKGQKCSTSFKLTNLMHTMSVAVSLNTTNPSLFSFTQSYCIIPPLSCIPCTLFLSETSDQPPPYFQRDVIIIQSTILPTGKAHLNDLRRMFSRLGQHVFRDASIVISLVGPQVADFLIARHTQILGALSFFNRAISSCTVFQLSTLLRLAVASGAKTFVTSLVEAGGDVNFLDSDGRSLMVLAVRVGDIDMVKFLMASGCASSEPEVDLLLHEAAKVNRVDLMEVLVEGFGTMDMRLVDADGRTPIHIAAIHGNVEMIEFCVSLGGDPNVVDSKGWTPLHFAAAEGHLDVVECLLECSNVKYVVNEDGNMAFSLALENGHSRLLDLLYLGDVLHHAARVGDMDAMKSSLTEGAMVNGRDQNGWTPLHRAAFKGRIECVKLLLDHGARVDIVDDLGYTPLHSAIEAGHVEIALLLVARGAQVHKKSLKGVSAAPLNFDIELKNHPSLVPQTFHEKEKT